MLNETSAAAPTPTVESALPEPYCLSREVEKLTRASGKTLRRWVASGSFPAPVFLGNSNRPRWRREDVLAYLAGKR